MGRRVEEGRTAGLGGEGGEGGLADLGGEARTTRTTAQQYQGRNRDAGQPYSREGHHVDKESASKGKDEDAHERRDDDYEAALQGTWLQYFMEPGRGHLIQALRVSQHGTAVVGAFLIGVYVRST